MKNDERIWVQRYANQIDRIEEILVDWHDLIDRKKYNRMNGFEQEAYEAQLKKKAQKVKYRAYVRDMYHEVSKSTYTWIKESLFEGKS